MTAEIPVVAALAQDAVMQMEDELGNLQPLEDEFSDGDPDSDPRDKQVVSDR